MAMVTMETDAIGRGDLGQHRNEKGNLVNDVLQNQFCAADQALERKASIGIDKLCTWRFSKVGPVRTQSLTRR